MLVQFPLSQTFSHFVQLLTPFLEAYIQIRMISCILLFETLRQISLDGSGINKVRGAGVGAGAGGLLDASCI